MFTREMLLEATWRLYGEGRGCYRRACRVCGTVFFVGRPEARYCRAACRQRAYRARRRRARHVGPCSQERDPVAVAAGSMEVEAW